MSSSIITSDDLTMEKSPLSLSPYQKFMYALTQMNQNVNIQRDYKDFLISSILVIALSKITVTYSMRK
jgi:hypothetical protein